MLFTRQEGEHESYVEEHQIRGGGGGTHQVRLGAVLRVRVRLQDGFEMPQEFRQPQLTVGLCLRSRLRFLIFIVVGDADWVMHVVGLGSLTSIQSTALDRRSNHLVVEIKGG